MSTQGKHPGGRPTMYCMEMVEKARDYISGGWLKVGHKIPSHIGLGKYIRVSRITLYEWASHSDKKEFANILEQCMAEQQFVLLENGLDNTFNSAITKLVLGKHGFHEKKDTELTGADGKPLDTNWTINIVKSDIADDAGS